MLPTINLSSADFTSLTEGAGQSAGLPEASTAPEGSFADLLRGPIMVAVGEPFGESLPETGNGLPLPDSQALVGRFPGGQQEPSDSALDIDALAVLRSGETVNSAAERTVADIAKRTAAPALVAPLKNGQNRLPMSPTGVAAVPASLSQGEAVEGALTPVSARVVNEAAAQVTGSNVERALPVIAEQRAAMMPAATGDGSAAPGSDQAPGLIAASPSASAAPATGVTPFVPQSSLSMINQAPGPQIMESAIGVPVQDAQWSDSLGERVVFMSGNRIQNAEIRLTPAELGPIRVSVALEDGATHVTFSAQHVTTREAIEAALPRLREMLAEQGLSLGNASVADQGPNPESERSEVAEENDGTLTTADADNDGLQVVDAREISRRVAKGLVDTFA